MSTVEDNRIRIETAPFPLPDTIYVYYGIDTGIDGKKHFWSRHFTDKDKAEAFTVSQLRAANKIRSNQVSHLFTYQKEK
jgi:hypothetical protein